MNQALDNAKTKLRFQSLAYSMSEKFEQLFYKQKLKNLKQMMFPNKERRS